MRASIATTFLAMYLAGAAHGAAGEPGLAPFTAEYAVKYSSLSVGSSRLELRRDGAPGHWMIESRADASGLAPLIASGTVLQRSWFVVADGAVRPLRFRFDDGMKRRADDVALDFDWAAGRITGTAKGEPVDVPIEPNVQDPVSIQIATMVALMGGRQPGEIPLIEGPQAKLYAYTFERAESLETDAGTFDTLVYRSARAGSDRETLLWLAPSLGYLAVRVEQHRKGRRLFGMFLKKYVSGG